MTAEIVVMNREAVAVAADSAVTMYTGRVEKTSTSANKLFALSNNYPVGIMVYGNALFMDVAWETIIKEYKRSFLPKQGFATLNEYAENFISFLCYSNIPLPDLAEKNYISNFVQSILSKIRRGITEGINNAITQGQDFDESMVSQLAQEVINQYYDVYREKQQILPIDCGRIILRKYQRAIRSIIANISDEFNLLTNFRRRLRQLLIYAFTRSFSDNIYTGVVVTGFGEKEYFPSVRAYQVEGIIRYESEDQVKEVLKYQQDEDHSLGPNVIAGVIPFAQGDMICRFMEGVDPIIPYTEIEFLDGLCKDLTDKIVNQLNRYSDDEKEIFRLQLGQYGEDLVEEFINNMREYIKIYFSNPTVDAVSRLPKNELAIMAESLIHLTSLKWKVSPELETVAEPIDVAVISKGEGFIWIKRKHYFNADLNIQYFFKRLKEMIIYENKRDTENDAL